MGVSRVLPIPIAARCPVPCTPPYPTMCQPPIPAQRNHLTSLQVQRLSLNTHTHTSLYISMLFTYYEYGSCARINIYSKKSRTHHPTAPSPFTNNHHHDFKTNLCVNYIVSPLDHLTRHILQKAYPSKSISLCLSTCSSTNRHCTSTEINDNIV